MKLDESSINHNALRLIKNEAEALYDFIGDDNCEKYCLATLAEIRGIYLMADAMKEVLRT